MTHRSITLAAALTMTVAALVPASATEAPSAASADDAFSIPAVVGAAYHTPGVALSAADVRAQGGLLVPMLTRWERTRKAGAPAEAFKAPAAFTVAYRNRNIATNAAQVLKQGGFATAGVVRWMPESPATVEVTASTMTLGSL